MNARLQSKGLRPMIQKSASLTANPKHTPGISPCPSEQEKRKTNPILTEKEQT